MMDEDDEEYEVDLDEDEGLIDIDEMSQQGPGTMVMIREDDDEEEYYEEIEESEVDDDEIVDENERRRDVGVLEEGVTVHHHHHIGHSPQQSTSDYTTDKLVSAVIPACFVCGRTQSPKSRIFKWPKDRNTRRRWAEFLRVDERMINDNFATSFICCYHFHASSFLYSDDKIFWTRDAFPRYRSRKPLSTDPFPWELLQASNSHSSRPNPVPDLRNMPQPAIKILFRESNYKIKGRQKHQVALIPVHGSPYIFYEFSFNRQSEDGTKFYSCLGCRKAKHETKIKDVIRTIHLDGSTLLSRNDPLFGHHFACRPINMSQNVDRRHNTNVYNLRDPSTVTDDMYIQEDEMWPHASIIDESTGMTLQNDGMYYTPLVPQSMSQMEDTIDSQIDTRRNFDASLSGARISGMRASNKIRKRVLSTRSTVHSPSCHICLRRLPSTLSLSRHLMGHLRRMPNCTQCGQKCSPEDPPLARRQKICSSCFKR